MKQDRRVVLVRKCKLRILKIRFKKIRVAGFQKPLAEHHGIDRRPSIILHSTWCGFHKFQHLADMDADLCDIKRSSLSKGFLAEELVSEPVTEQANRILYAFCLLGHAEILRAHDLIFGEKLDVPLGRGIHIQGA